MKFITPIFNEDNMSQIMTDDFFAISNLNSRKHDIAPPPSDNDFNNIAGKGKLCKSAGLSGADKKSCKQNIKATCGRKPLFGRAKKDAWSKCASSAVVSPEQQAHEMAEKLVPTTRDGNGIGTGAIVMIAVAVVGTLALVGFAIVNRKKAQPQQMMATAPNRKNKIK